MMKMQNLANHILFLVAAVAIAFMIVSETEAATITSTTVVPTPDGADIYNLNTTASGSDLLNGDRPAAGQTFATLGNSTGYTLSALTFYNTRTVSTTGGTFNLRLGTVSGTNFTQTNTDSVTYGSSGITLSGSGNDFLTFTLTTPIQLDPNTLYGIDLVRTGGGNFLQWGKNADSNYLGGQSYTSPPNGLGGPTLSLQSNDKIFLLDLDENPPLPVPEPSTITLAALGVLGLIRYRRRRK